MLFSYNWLKKYVPDLPIPEKLEEGIIFHAFEVGSLEKRGDDTLLEIKVLPDRAHDCLCHLGVAREVAAIFNLSLEKPAEKSDLALGKMQELEVVVEAGQACRRYIGCRVKNISVGSSPKWLAEALEALGQRSISNIVDATNYVMFDLGQPMHAFDADKVEGNIRARFARAGETMTTLDGKELVLDEETLVIADDGGPLALAGIKGGNRAEVDAGTKNLILESANFDPVLIRRTSAKYGIRTDASKRYENELSAETALPAMKQLIEILQEIAGGEYCGVVDAYPERPAKRVIKTSLDYINKRLGVDVSATEVKDILERLGLLVLEEAGQLSLTIPYWRVDLEEEANIVEEVGRIYGYEKIKPRLLERAGRGESSSEPEVSPRGARTTPPAEKRFAFKNKIREILAKQGFVEVMGYALTDKGDIELANPLASDKAFLRTNLSDWLAERLKFNLEHVLFDNEPVKIFEIGKVFINNLAASASASASQKEETHLAIGLAYRKKLKGVDLKQEVDSVIHGIWDIFGVSNRGAIVHSSDTVVIWEINVEDLLSSDRNFDPGDLSDFYSPSFDYRPISLYPRIVRDVAVWVPEAISNDEVAKLIKENLSPLCVVGPILFDEFAKEGRKSLAFRLVFQSYDRTLSDDEANAEMSKVIEVLEAKGYEVRK